jgi:hypothetical protein
LSLHLPHSPGFKTDSIILIKTVFTSSSSSTSSSYFYFSSFSSSTSSTTFSSSFTSSSTSSSSSSFSSSSVPFICHVIASGFPSRVQARGRTNPPKKLYKPLPATVK